MTQLTPQILRDKGFSHIPAGISGADQWQGIGFWHNDSKQISFRGNISTARGGTLHIMGQPGLMIDTVEELDIFLSLCK